MSCLWNKIISKVSFLNQIPIFMGLFQWQEICFAPNFAEKCFCGDPKSEAKYWLEVSTQFLRKLLKTVQSFSIKKGDRAFGSQAFNKKRTFCVSFLFSSLQFQSSSSELAALSKNETEIKLFAESSPAMSFSWDTWAVALLIKGKKSILSHDSWLLHFCWQQQLSKSADFFKHLAFNALAYYSCRHKVDLFVYLTWITSVPPFHSTDVVQTPAMPNTLEFRLRSVGPGMLFSFQSLCW